MFLMRVLINNEEMEFSVCLGLCCTEKLLALILLVFFCFLWILCVRSGYREYFDWGFCFFNKFSFLVDIGNELRLWTCWKCYFYDQCGFSFSLYVKNLIFFFLFFISADVGVVFKLDKETLNMNFEFYFHNYADAL